MTFEIVDVVIVAWLLLSVSVGVLRGFIKEIMLITVLLIAIAGAYYGADVTSRWVPDEQWHVVGYTVSMQTVGYVASFALILLVLLVLGRVLVTAVKEVLYRSGVGIADRVLGSGFGLLRGLAVAAILVALGSLTAFPTHAWWQNSSLMPYMEHLADYGVNLLPHQYQEYFYFPSRPTGSSEPSGSGE